MVKPPAHTMPAVLIHITAVIKLTHKLERKVWQMTEAFWVKTCDVFLSRAMCGHSEVKILHEQIQFYSSSENVSMRSQSLHLLPKEFLEVFPDFANMSKASTLLTVSADKPDTAFHHQRNCLAGILKNQRENMLGPLNRDSPGSIVNGTKCEEPVSADQWPVHRKVSSFSAL